MKLALGSTFDRYTIEALLGEGGMGEVYRAYDPRLRRHLALKVLRPPKVDKVESVANAENTGASAIDAGQPSRRHDRDRLLQEERAAAALDHTNASPLS